MTLPRPIAIRTQVPRAALSELRTDFDAWLTHRRNQDREDQQGRLDHHRRQLDTLAAIFEDGLTNFEKVMNAGFAGADLTLDVASDRCRAYLTAAVGMRRLLEFFKERFDQRDRRDEWRACLSIADEVVWSYYRPAFTMLPSRPVPLPYLESRFSPAMVLADQAMPRSLRLEVQLQHLENFLQTLPLAFVSIPVWSIGAPWWLILMAHEMGHQVQHELKLVETFKAGLKGALAKLLTSADDLAAWEIWSEEIFADLYSVHLAGPAAVRALVETLRGAPATMATRWKYYPAPAIRLALMERACTKLRLTQTGIPPELDLARRAQESAEARRDWEVVDAVVKFGLSPWMGKDRSLATLTGWETKDFARGGPVDAWAKYLVETNHVALGEEPTLRTVRQIVSGAFWAWIKVIDAKQDGAPDQPQLDHLAENTSAAILACRRPQTRPVAPMADAAGKGTELIEQLMAPGIQS